MKSTKFKLMSFLVTCAGLFLAGCAQTPASVDVSPQVGAKTEMNGGKVAVNSRTNLDPLGGFFENPLRPSSSQSRIVVYQARDEKLAGATGVFVDGTYHASVTPGAWSQLCYRTGEVQLAARQMQVGTRAKDLFDTITAIHLAGGQTHFFRVVEDGSRPVLQPVPSSQALREMEGSRQQQHTISRVAQECVRVADATLEPTASPAKQEPKTVTAHVLFDFDKSDTAGMTRASLQMLDAQLMQMRAEGTSLQRVHVIGHADPIGRPHINERLALRRAQTVSDYLQVRLPEGVRISQESRGANEPVVERCHPVPVTTNIVCNALNRRVEVLLVGITP